MPSRIEPARLERLLEAGRNVLWELDTELVLDRLLDTARELTGARYAALGVIAPGARDERGDRSLATFITSGVDAATHRAIGDLPRGRGILGLLVDEPTPLRLDRIADHEASFGFPPNHPTMETFLGVPVMIRGRAWGNLYLTERADGQPFSEADEATAVVLADWAAIAIEHARLYGAVSRRRAELERAVHSYEATSAIARALGAETDLQRILDLVADRARALVSARTLVIVLGEAPDMQIAAAAGRAVPEPGAPAIGRTAVAGVATGGGPRRLDEVDADLRPLSEALGVPDAAAAVLVPLAYRGRPIGTLVAFDRTSGTPEFTPEDVEVLTAAAAQAATAVATAQSVASERLRLAMGAAEGERRRWARELHDETLQGLAGLKVLLGSTLRRATPEEMRTAIESAVGHVGDEIERLRAIIADVRPAALDELGLEPALRTLIARTAERSGLKITLTVALEALDGRRLTPELETTVYRLVQEAISNALKHARASRVDVTLAVAGAQREVRLLVKDDGVGLDAEAVSAATGFGIVGMRERVTLEGGQMTLDGSNGGTTVEVVMPLAAVATGGE